MKLATLHRPLICGTCSWLMWAAPSEARFLQVDPVGYEDQINLYAYVGDDPVNLFDPDGTQVEVRLQGYPLGNAPLIGRYGHAFVRYRDIRTGETRITRAGPDREYTGGTSGRDYGGALNQSDGAQIFALDSPQRNSRDFNVIGTVTLDQVVVPGAIGDVQAQVGAFNLRTNDADIPYLPQSSNSNTYAGDMFEEIATREPANHSDIAFPGLASDLRPRDRPPCIPVKDTTGCR